MNSNPKRGQKWMSYMSDNSRLSELTIPGTHNTCAYQSLAKCQSIPLRNQLNAGVRFLDIRCRHIEDRFDIYHGSFDLNQRFDIDVLHVCVEFLRSNPSETIVMLAKTEHLSKDNTMPFDELFYRYVEVQKAHWFLDEHIPTLGECRGKIVLLRRFSTSKKPFGIDMSGWQHKQAFHLKNHSNFKFQIQDVYKLNANKKWQYVKEMLGLVNSKANDMPNTWYVNYCSAQNWPFQPPYLIAMLVNKNLRSYLKEENKETNQLGTVVLDFVNKQMVEKLFLLNFKSNEL